MYGPLCCGATVVLFEGVPTHPTPDRYWRLIERYRITQFYTAPTAIRALKRLGDAPVTACDLSSLRVLGSVGEPINPEAWKWFYTVVGHSRCSIVDTYWQTETGGIILTPLPGATPMKPGSGTLPFFGIQLAILDQTTGALIHGAGSGVLVVRSPWPGMARTLYRNHERFLNTYLKQYPGYYFTGDGAMRDEDGYYWILGRVDGLASH